MRAGYYNERRDRLGNNIVTYNPDTRKEFIESVETLKMVMACDIDDEATKAIEKIEKESKAIYLELCEQEKKQWIQANIPLKNQWHSQGIFYRENMLNEKFPFALEYLMERVIIARKLFAELTKLTKRLGFYGEEWIEA